jgi:DNA-binding SARP family transcriptional activator/basic membrane lipoprotein Med (substrate-binding protein (PBP1-ABC) superfamily)
MARTIESSVRFRLLGPLGVDTTEGLIDLGPPKQRSVLAILLLHANEIVPTDRIIDMVWGENPPRTAEHSVQIYISDLRKVLSNGSSNELIGTRPPGYVINVPPDSIDTLRFERLVREGLSALRTGDVAGGRPKLEKALESWTASPLADFAYDDFAQGYIRSLTELHSDALEAMAGVDLDRGRHEEARDLARQAIEADPLREEPRRLMMLALYRSGRQAESLRHFGEYQRLLAEELGIEPSENLRLLEERVLLQDPTLNMQTHVISEGNPYRGLRAFSEEDADIYFGRESLVAEVREKLVTGPGFVSIVGPSGSGKSSAAQAGLIPTLRAEGEAVVVFQPGSRPLWELAGALDRAGFGSRAGLLRRFESDASALLPVIDRSVVLIVDQFEELFTLAEADDAIRFAEVIVAAIRDPETPLRVVATLRADYYDKPLSIPALAGVFSDSVVSVKPMTPQEIEHAVVEPAGAAGVKVEPALLAQLVADMGNEPGALPLLQFTLFELFERTSNVLTLGDYQSLGGINGALIGGADAVLDELDAEGKELTEQLMMRMVQKGRVLSTSRPVPLRDLLDLGIDRIALQGVLEALGARRLITFDRDPSGAAVVEMAHEYLISEWPQLESWIAEHSDDLDRLYALDIVAAEWIESDKSEDYLLRGERLDQFEAWATSTSLMRTSTETQFIDASVEMRRREGEARLDQTAKEETLQKSARRRLWYFGGAVAALAAAVTLLVVMLLPEPPPDVILWSGASAVSGFDELVHSGYGAGLEANELTGREFVDNLVFLPDIETLLERGTPLVIMSSKVFFDDSVRDMMNRYPEGSYILIDCSVEPATYAESVENIACIVGSHDEIGYLAGVAAGLITETNHVGIVVGTDADFMLPFHTGFEQGATRVNPEIEVGAVYLTSIFDLSGYSSTTMGNWGAEVLIKEGSDVVFQAAGFSGHGVFNAVASAAQETGSSMWAIGVDNDEYSNVLANPWFEPVAEFWTAHIATSIVKRIDIGVEEAIARFVLTGTPQLVVLSIENGGVDYVTTGGFIDHIVPELEAAKADVISGAVVLSTEAPEEIRMLDDVIGP